MSTTTTSELYHPYGSYPDSLWFLWEFLLLVAVYIFCFAIFALLLYIYVKWLRSQSQDQATTTADIPEEFQYREADLSETNKDLLGIQDVTSAFMMASDIGKKLQSNQTIITVVDENEEDNEEESEASTEETRPGSGIQQETLTEITNTEEDVNEEDVEEEEDDEESNE